MVRTKRLAKDDYPHNKLVREQAKIDADERRAVRKKSWYSELDDKARPVVERLDAEQIAQLDGMKEVERQTKILQYVEEENSKKKQRQLKALASSSNKKGKASCNRYNTKACFFAGPATVTATAFATPSATAPTATATATAPATAPATATARLKLRARWGP